MKENVLILLILLSGFVRSQSISPEVISSSGDFYSNSNGMISFTEGEPIGELVSSSSHLITQGFDQPDMTVLFVNEIEKTIQNLFIYPNPCDGHFKIKNFDKLNIEKIEVFNNLGEEILLETSVYEKKEVSINLSYSPGLYIVLIHSNGMQFSKKLIVN
jgi:hypothetical protein